MAVVFTMQSNAQSTGQWDASTSQTTTTKAVGIGTTNPRAWQEIRYCPPIGNAQNGLIITQENCNKALIGLGTGGTELDPNIILANGNGGGNGNNPVVVPFTVPAGTYNLFTRLPNTYTFTGNDAPLLWARLENPLASTLPMGMPPNFDTKLIVMPDGTVGINNASPRASLDVTSNGINTPTAIFGRPRIGAPAPLGAPTLTKHIQVNNHLGANAYNTITQQGDQGIFFTDGTGTEGSNTSGALVIAPWSADANNGGIRLEANGNMELRGNLRATKVTVNTKWWDSVFEPNYALMPLTEVEMYIHKNKHLPQIPTQAEIETQGVNVGEMAGLQIKKIEELTLYIIAQNKQLEAQQAQLHALQAQVKTLLNK